MERRYKFHCLIVKKLDGKPGIIEKRIKELIKERGAILLKKNEALGEVKFSYPIHHQKEGLVFNFEIKAEPEIISGLVRQIRLMPEILRILIVKEKEKKEFLEEKVVSEVNLKEIDKKLDEVLKKDY